MCHVLFRKFKNLRVNRHTFKKAFVCFDARVFKCDPFGAERDKVFVISLLQCLAHKLYPASAPI